ncbi:MAG: hypothetical protein HOY76_01695 [Streptomyces sp.]|nr:hypothetical protein [Streptomyces sp.]
MPGVEPAGSTPPPFETEPDIADVVSLGSRRRARTIDREEPPVNRMRDGDSPTPEEQLALTVEGLYMHRRRTLTDPATAEAYDVAFEVALIVVEGALTRGHISAEQHRLLAGMLQDARDVPDVL